MSFLTDLYNGKLNGKSWSMPTILPPNQVRSLPYGAGSYSATGGITPSQVSNTPIGPQNYTPPAYNPIFTPPTQTNTTPAQTAAPVTNTKYINPATGEYFKTAQEYANYVASKIPASKNTGDIGNYAGGQITNPNQTTEQLTSAARNMNNARNDIAVGATDPYKVASGSGLSYSGAELAAIEKAYAGIYDPALNDVFAKLEAKKKEEQTAADRKAKLEEMALQHKYNMAEKSTALS